MAREEYEICDNCGKKKRRLKYELWEDRTLRMFKEYHFCSKKCLREWLGIGLKTSIEFKILGIIGLLISVMFVSYGLVYIKDMMAFLLTFFGFIIGIISCLTIGAGNDETEKG